MGWKMMGGFGQLHKNLTTLFELFSALGSLLSSILVPVTVLIPWATEIIGGGGEYTPSTTQKTKAEARGHICVFMDRMERMMVTLVLAYNETIIAPAQNEC